MKKNIALSILIVSVIMIGTSCKKYTSGYMHGNPIVPRLVQFVLFSNNELSNDNNTVTFTLAIKKPNGDVLWDSVLAPMKIKDIPTLDHPVFAEKYVPGNDPSLLKVGFFYTIDNVGNSSFTVPFEPGETLKKVGFNFKR
ncbi:MAG TPA: hypothetical protein VK492_15540 [Chitinophagaceae bacterium]|nr:hypothetical protein [Chitinophagaceae bacterium]